MSEADQSKESGKEDTNTDSESDPEGEGGGGGFGGIRMSSVQEVIAKARFAEAFNIASTVGLSENLEDLAKFVDEEQQQEEEGSGMSSLQYPLLNVKESSLLIHCTVTHDG